MQPERFTIAIPESSLGDLRARLERFRAAPDFGNQDWRYGMEGGVIRSLVDTWLDDYDWRAAEAEMNRFEHWRVMIDGIPIHYMRKRGVMGATVETRTSANSRVGAAGATNGGGSVSPKPMPLVVTHGWPWTFWDHRYVIEPLADPGASGGDPADAFDVIVPSLPGYAFSSPLTKTGIGWARTADLWAKLMKEVLGYERFAAAGGDWGAFVTAQLGHKYAPLLHGVYESFPAIPGLDYFSVRESDYADDEKALYARRVEAEPTASSHMAVHSMDPQTLAIALNDSPAGLLAWIVERRRAWSDCGGDVERAFTREHLLTTASLYWLTQTIGSSLRFYWETARQDWRPSHLRKPTIEAPTAMAILPRDVFPLPRKLVEQHANLQSWRVYAKGGHFGPAEAPEEYVEDVRGFFRRFRG
jgi:pimeloyl-ACP methyl ester carboxylesterase